MRDLFQWFVYSSANPQAISLTLKGLVPLLVLLGVDSSLSDTLSEGVAQVVVHVGLILSAVATLVGLVRKLLHTAKS